jgi:hypothetical protein
MISGAFHNLLLFIVNSFYIIIARVLRRKFIVCYTFQVPIDSCIVGAQHSAFLQQVLFCYYLHPTFCIFLN